MFAVKEDMGFNEVEAKSLLLNMPKVYNICKYWFINSAMLFFYLIINCLADVMFADTFSALNIAMGKIKQTKNY